MAKQINHFYEFGSVRLDAANLLLYKDGAQLSLQPKVIETLLVLVKNAHTVVDKETLLNALWQDVIVEEGGLKRNISLLRKALGDEGHFIETLPKRGYRFTAEVKEDWGEVPAYTNADIVLARRANLRITQEEEISDAGDSHPEISLGRKSFETAPIQQRSLISSLRRHILTISTAAVVVLLAGLGFWWVTSKPNTATAAPIKSIAVLPFKILATSHRDDDHSGVGIADVLITRLSNIKELKVRPTSTVLKFNNQEQDSIAAGQTLGVDAVLEGSIYRAGDRIRITARLVRVSDQVPIWAGQFDEKEAHFLLMQNTIAQQVVSSLALNLSLGEKDALTKRYTESADAFQLYVTGRYHWNKRDYEGMLQAENFFRKAIEKDPDFALAYLGLADMLSMGASLSESEYAIKKAIELDDKLGEAYASRGFWKTFNAWQWDEAEADFKQAIKLNPGYGTAHQWYATLLAITGRVEEAKAQMRRALEIDPTSHNFLADMGQMHYLAREYAEAESYCLKALEIYPDFVFAHQYLRDIYLARGEDDKAFEELLKTDRPLSSALRYVKEEEMLAREQSEREIYRRSGLKGVWKDLLKGRHKSESYYWMLLHYRTLLGDKQEALEALEKSYESKQFLLPFVNVDPLYDDLRSEPRCRAILQRMGLD